MTLVRECIGLVREVGAQGRAESLGELRRLSWWSNWKGLGLKAGHQNLAQKAKVQKKFLKLGCGLDR